MSPTQEYVINSKIGSDMIRLAVSVASVDVHLLEKNPDGTNGRAFYYRKGRTGKNVYLELFVHNAGEETIGNFNNCNVAVFGIRKNL